MQRSVEAIAGRLVHKQNFRRLIEQQELVEETGAAAQDTGGRPAKLFRFRRAILAERDVVGTKLPLSRVDIPYAQSQHMLRNAQTEYITMLSPLYEKVRHVIPPVEWPFLPRISTRS